MISKISMNVVKVMFLYRSEHGLSTTNTVIFMLHTYNYKVNIGMYIRGLVMGIFPICTDNNLIVFIESRRTTFCELTKTKTVYKSKPLLRGVPCMLSFCYTININFEIRIRRLS